MPCPSGPVLAKVFDLLDRHILVAAQVEQAVKQHRAVPGGEDKAIAIGPVGGGGIELEKIGEQYAGDIGHTHRQPGVPRVGFLHRVHRQCANRIRHRAPGFALAQVFFKLGIHIGSLGFRPRGACARPFAAPAV
jgi:hypothetical protein